MNQFLADVIEGLSAKDKYLQSKYFYNKEGDRLFQKIMGSPEYYPTRCELEIFTLKTSEIVKAITAEHQAFDLVELGAGDVTKSIYLLRELARQNIQFTYYPVDISPDVITFLNKSLPEHIPSIKIHGLNGEYLQMLEKAGSSSGKPKVVLFLGGNIGNVPFNKAVEFCLQVRKFLSPGDLVITGFDLKKNPILVLNAYNDQAGYTRDFNLNLLKRINEDLKGNFDLKHFYHYPTYDPSSGACKSFLVSTKFQQVEVADCSFKFYDGEPIFMEIAQKYSVDQTDWLAGESGFIPRQHLFDSKRWFLDAIWQCN